MSNHRLQKTNNITVLLILHTTYYILLLQPLYGGVTANGERTTDGNTGKRS